MKFYKFSNKKVLKKNLNKKLFLFLCENIKGSIFQLLGYDFFLNYYLKNNLDYIYISINKSNLVSLVSYITIKKEKELKKNIFFYLLKKPWLILSVFFNISNYFKLIKTPSNYLQLFHLIIIKSKLNKKITKKQKYNFINNLHKKILQKKFKGIYAVHKNNNISASKYYKNNRYILFRKNLFFSVVFKNF